MTASNRIGLPLIRFTLCVLAVLAVAVANDSNDSEDATPDPALPTSPPVLPMLVPADTSATAVTVHVAERFLPFASRTIVGPVNQGPTQNSEEDDDDGDDRRAFRVMFSFSAYAFRAANAATMDCFSIYDDGRAWEKETPDSSTTKGTQAFCVRRDIVDDSSSYGVAVFRKPDNGSSLVHASRDSTVTVIAQAVVRGWTEPPVAVFRVQRLQKWQQAPSLTLVANVSAITVLPTAAGEIVSNCPLDPLGHAVRRIEGGNYYQSTTEKKITVLCVSYVQRSLHDLNGADKFVAVVRPVELSDWRLNVCPWRSKEIMDAVTHTNILLSSPDSDYQLICYKHKTLADEDDVSDLTDTDELLKRIWFNETKPYGIERLVIEHHDKDAWAFMPHADDLVAINNF